MVHTGGDDSPGVSPRMVRFAASLAAKSADNVKGVVAARGDPVLRATAWHVKVRIRTIHCVARPASPGLPDLDLRYRSMFIAIWNLHRLVNSLHELICRPTELLYFALQIWRTAASLWCLFEAGWRWRRCTELVHHLSRRHCKNLELQRYSQGTIGNLVCMQFPLHSFVLRNAYIM